MLLLLSHFSRVQLCATPQTAAHQAPLSLGFSRQEHWSGLPFPSPVHESEKWKWSRLVVSDPQWPHGLQLTRLLRPWDLPGKSTGVGCHCLLRISCVTSDNLPTSLSLNFNFYKIGIIIAICCCSVTKSCPILCDPMDCSTPGFPVLYHLMDLLKLMSIEAVMPSNHLIFCHPLLFLPSMFPSIRVFSNESILHTRWQKYWSFNFSISPSNEYSGLISFRMDWFDLLAILALQDTL